MIIQGGVGTYRVCVVVQGGCGRTGWGGDIQGGVETYRVGTYRVQSYRVGWGRTECGRTGWGEDIQGGDVRGSVIQGGVGTYRVGSVIQGGVGTYRVQSYRVGWDIWGAVVRGGLPSGATFTYVPKGTYLDGKSRTALKTALA